MVRANCLHGGVRGVVEAAIQLDPLVAPPGAQLPIPVSGASGGSVRGASVVVRLASKPGGGTQNTWIVQIASGHAK